MAQHFCKQQIKLIIGKYHEVASDKHHEIYFYSFILFYIELNKNFNYWERVAYFYKKHICQQEW